MFKRLSVVGFAAANNLQRFICDELSDIANLPTLTSPSQTAPYCEPCGAGSTAIVIAANKEFMLNNANEWKPCKNLNNDGDVTIVTEDGDLDVATVSEVSNYIG